eukprot:10964-Heterococcus_DN1.PRE.2
MHTTDEIAAAARSYKKRRILSENSSTNAEQHRSSECRSVANDNEHMSEAADDVSVIVRSSELCTHSLELQQLLAHTVPRCHWCPLLCADNDANDNADDSAEDSADDSTSGAYVKAQGADQQHCADNNADESADDSADDESAEECTGSAHVKAECADDNHQHCFAGYSAQRSYGGVHIKREHFDDTYQQHCADSDAESSADGIHVKAESFHGNEQQQQQQQQQQCINCNSTYCICHLDAMNHNSFIKSEGDADESFISFTADSSAAAAGSALAVNDDGKH